MSVFHFHSSFISYVSLSYFRKPSTQWKAGIWKVEYYVRNNIVSFRARPQFYLFSSKENKIDISALNCVVSHFVVIRVIYQPAIEFTIEPRLAKSKKYSVIKNAY